jgi:hypothetical protein
MPWGAAAVAGASLIGSQISSQANKSAANTAAEAQRYAADQAAAAQQFRPIGITTGFGTSRFGYENTPKQSFEDWAASMGYTPQGAAATEFAAAVPGMSPEQIATLRSQYEREVPREQGALTSAGYTLTPELQTIRDRMLSQAGAYNPAAIGQAAQPLMGGAQGLFSLGQQYLATSPQQAAQDYIAQQRTLLAPGQEAALSKVRSSLFGSGRAGLGVQTGTGSAPTSPELQAYYNALAQQEAQLAANADLYGQQRVQFGAGLFGTGASLLGQVPTLTTAGYGPLQTQLGLAGTIEGLGQQPFDLSTALGARQATAGANVGQSLLQGGLASAGTQYRANAYSPLGSTLTGLGSSISPGTTNQLGTWFNNMINYGGTPQGAYGQQNSYLSSIPSSGGTQQQQALLSQGGPDFLRY